MKTLLVAGLLSLASISAAFANPIVCDRTKLSTSGFNSVSAAESWFPKQIFFEIKGDQLTRSTYGAGSVEDEGTRKRMKVPMDGGGTLFTLNIRYFPNNKRASVWLDTGPRYETITPSRYSCQG